MADHATFSIRGALVRKPYLSPSGKFAMATVEVAGHPRNKKIEVRAFHDTAQELAALVMGATVTLEGHIDTDVLMTKAKQEVMVDGYKKWIFPLTVQKVITDGASKPAAQSLPSSGETGWDKKDDDIPF